jgi:hypothetical protein
MSNLNKRFTNWFNLRTLVIIIALYLILVPSKPTVLDWLDRSLFSVGSGLMKSPAPDVDVAIITLPQEEYVSLREDWSQTAASFDKNNSSASARITFTPILSANISITWSPSCKRNKPLSTKTQVS